MAHDSRKTHRTGEKYDTRRDLDDQIRRSASQRKALVTADQLRLFGLTANGIRSRVQTSRLHRVFAGVYSLAPPPHTQQQRWLAAVLACGHGSLISHLQAAALLRMVDDGPGPIHVTVPPASGRRPGQRNGIVVHRSLVEPCDVGGRHGILCTSAARTILDLSASLGREELESILIAANSLRILNVRRLDELVAASAGHRGVKTLRSLLSADQVRVRSKAELAMLRIIRAAGLPEPLVNQRVAGLEVDFCWPDLRLIVEVDGYRFHGGRERANSDRDREQRLTIAGWRVVRFTRDQIVADRDECIRRLAGIAATCSGR